MGWETAWPASAGSVTSTTKLKPRDHEPKCGFLTSLSLAMGGGVPSQRLFLSGFFVF